MSVEEAKIHYFLLSSSASATTLLPGQDKPGPSGPMSRGSCVVVSCGVRWSEVGLSEIRKPQVAPFHFDECVPHSWRELLRRLRSRLLF